MRWPAAFRLLFPPDVPGREPPCAPELPFCSSPALPLLAAAEAEEEVPSMSALTASSVLRSCCSLALVPAA